MKIGVTTNPEARRLCSFIIIDENRLLLQNPADCNKGELLTDRDRVRAIAAEYDGLSRQLLGQ